MTEPGKEQEPIRILVVDDHVILRDGIVSFLNAQPDFEVVGEAGTVADAVTMVRQTRPDVVLMDYTLPDGTGLEATQSILAHRPTINIVFLTVHEEDDLLFAAIRSGAKGYLLKNISSTELLGRLRGLVRGQAPISDQMTGRILAEFARSTPAPRPVSLDEPPLTPRELEVLRLIARGASNATIARRLVISLNTVKNHVHHILAKLEVSNRAEAARVGKARGLIQPEAD